MDDYQGAMAKYFENQEALYDAGARNFLLIDVPPIHYSPACKYHHILLFYIHVTNSYSSPKTFIP